MNPLITLAILGALSAIGLRAIGADKKTDPCAVKGSNLAFPKGKKLQVLKYNAATASYEVQSAEFPGEGTSLVTLEALSEGAKGVRAKHAEAAAKPEILVGQTFETDRAVPTLFERENDARKNCGPSK